MTETCPKCGGKWQQEGIKDRNPEATHCILIPNGELVTVICYYCDTTLDYPLSREQLEEFHRLDMRDLYKELERAEKKLKTQEAE